MTEEPKPVDIGFVEKKDSWLLHPKFFPSKVGGKPAWLNLNDLPKPSDLTCPRCEDPMVFLCQVYAPYEESDKCFHRTIFIFICRNGLCCKTNNSENLVILRSQLPRKNDFYCFEPSAEVEGEEFSMQKWQKLCFICGGKAPSHCSKCKQTFYCGRKHQVLHWQKGHKEECEKVQSDLSHATHNKYNFVPTEAGKSLLLEEWELIVDEEDQEEMKQIDENTEMDKFRKMLQERKVGTMNDISENELEQYSKDIPEDKIFNKFNKRVARHPDQVLRYDRGGHPLWITVTTGNAIIDVQKCEYCNGERQFEFQIMPQLLNFLNVGLDVNSIDWGVLAIYTCKGSCQEGPAYKKEFCIKQDLIN